MKKSETAVVILERTGHVEKHLSSNSRSQRSRWVCPVCGCGGSTINVIQSMSSTSAKKLKFADLTKIQQFDLLYKYLGMKLDCFSEEENNLVCAICLRFLDQLDKLETAIQEIVNLLKAKSWRGGCGSSSSKDSCSTHEKPNSLDVDVDIDTIPSTSKLVSNQGGDGNSNITMDMDMEDEVAVRLREEIVMVDVDVDFKMEEEEDVKPIIVHFEEDILNSDFGEGPQSPITSVVQLPSSFYPMVPGEVIPSRKKRRKRQRDPVRVHFPLETDLRTSFRNERHALLPAFPSTSKRITDNTYQPPVGCSHPRPTSRYRTLLPRPKICSPHMPKIPPTPLPPLDPQESASEARPTVHNRSRVREVFIINPWMENYKETPINLHTSLGDDTSHRHRNYEATSGLPVSIIVPRYFHQNGLDVTTATESSPSANVSNISQNFTSPAGRCQPNLLRRKPLSPPKPKTPPTSTPVPGHNGLDVTTTTGSSASQCANLSNISQNFSSPAVRHQAHAQPALLQSKMSSLPKPKTPLPPLELQQSASKTPDTLAAGKSLKIVPEERCIFTKTVITRTEAVCHHCGTRSQNLHRCDYCGSALPPGTKLMHPSKRGSKVPISSASPSPSVGIDVSNVPGTARPSMRNKTVDVNKLVLSNTARLEPLPLPSVTVECRAIKIGSYQSLFPNHTTRVSVIFSQKGISCSLPPFRSKDKHQNGINFTVAKEDILRIDAQPTGSFPVIFVMTGTRGTSLIREMMKFSDDPESPNFHYDPVHGDKRHKKIVFHPSRQLVGEIGQLSKMFGPGTVCKINPAEANNILLDMKTLPSV